MSHTPGPWVVGNVGEVKAGGITLADVYGDEEQADVDAHLIAAAPDLLAALEDMLGHCQGCNGKGRRYGPVPGSPGTYASNQPCVDCVDARAAIAKARRQG